MLCLNFSSKNSSSPTGTVSCLFRIRCHRRLFWAELSSFIFREIWSPLQTPLSIQVSELIHKFISRYYLIYDFTEALTFECVVINKLLLEVTLKKGNKWQWTTINTTWYIFFSANSSNVRVGSLSNLFKALAVCKLAAWINRLIHENNWKNPILNRRVFKAINKIFRCAKDEEKLYGIITATSYIG